MSVLDYIVHCPECPPADQCAPVIAERDRALLDLQSAEGRAFQLEQANGVLTCYALVLAVAFIVPAVTVGLKRIAGQSEELAFIVSGLLWRLADMLERGQNYIQICTVFAAASSMVNAFGVKEGSWILPTDPVTASHKVYTDWQSGRSLSLVRSNTTSNMVDNLQVTTNVLAFYMFAGFGVFMITWEAKAIRAFTRFNIWFARCFSAIVLRFTSWVDCVILHVQRVLLFCFINIAIDAWNRQKKPSNQYVEAALSLHRIANEGVGGLVYRMIDHFMSNTAGGGLPQQQIGPGLF